MGRPALVDGVIERLIGRLVGAGVRQRRATRVAVEVGILLLCCVVDTVVVGLHQKHGKENQTVIASSSFRWRLLGCVADAVIVGLQKGDTYLLNDDSRWVT